MSGPEYSKEYGHIEKIDEGCITKYIAKVYVDWVWGTPKKRRPAGGVKDLVDQNSFSFQQDVRQAKDKKNHEKVYFG